MGEKLSNLTDIDLGLDVDEWMPSEISNWIRYHAKRLGVPHS